MLFYIGPERNYTEIQRDRGSFPHSHKIAERPLINAEACKAWCDATDGCEAIVISPSPDMCILVSTKVITYKENWSAAHHIGESIV